MLDGPAFAATSFTRPALRAAVLLISIVMISMTTVKPAQASGTVPHAFASCSNYLFQNARTGYEQGGYSSAAAACGPSGVGTYAGNGNYYCGNSTELRAL